MTVEKIMKRGMENTADDLMKAMAALAKLREQQKEAMKTGDKKALASLRGRIRKREQEVAALRLFVGDPGKGWPEDVTVRGGEA